MVRSCSLRWPGMHLAVLTVVAVGSLSPPASTAGLSSNTTQLGKSSSGVRSKNEGQENRALPPFAEATAAQSSGHEWYGLLWGEKPASTDPSTVMLYKFSGNKDYLTSEEFLALVQCTLARESCPELDDDAVSAYSILTNCSTNPQLKNLECDAFHKCLNHTELLQLANSGGDSRVSVASLRELFPLLLAQVQNPLCRAIDLSAAYELATTDDPNPGNKKPTSLEVWGFGLLFVTLISVCSLVGVSVMPLMARKLYQQLLTGLIGLAAGSLAASALFHLLPQAFRLPQLYGNHDYLFTSLYVLLGLWAFLMIERIIKICITAHSRRHSEVKSSLSAQAIVPGGEDDHHAWSSPHGGSSDTAASPVPGVPPPLLTGFSCGKIPHETSHNHCGKLPLPESTELRLCSVCGDLVKEAHSGGKRCSFNASCDEKKSIGGSFYKKIPSHHSAVLCSSCGEGVLVRSEAGEKEGTSGDDGYSSSIKCVCSCCVGGACLCGGDSIVGDRGASSSQNNSSPDKLSGELNLLVNTSDPDMVAAQSDTEAMNATNVASEPCALASEYITIIDVSDAAKGSSPGERPWVCLHPEVSRSIVRTGSSRKPEGCTNSISSGKVVGCSKCTAGSRCSKCVENSLVKCDESSFTRCSGIRSSSTRCNRCRQQDVQLIFASQQQAIKASFGHEQKPPPSGHSHQEVDYHPGESSVIGTVAWMIIFGDGFHNFLDGVSIGAAFSQSKMTGISISLAVMCEELPHELGDFAVLLNAGMSMRQALMYNFLSATTCYLGLVIGILLGEFTQDASYIFALAAGMFLYISCVDMVPELNEEVNKAIEKGTTKDVLWTLLLQNIGLFLGVLSLFLLAYFQNDIVFD